MEETKVVEKKQYSVDELEYFIHALRDSLTKVFARHSIEKLTGFAVSGKTLANLMSNNAGPPSFKIGRTVCFERDSFIQWLIKSGRVNINN